MPNYGFIPGTAEVAYPDIAYAPGYGYDSSYAASNKYVFLSILVLVFS